MGNKNSRVNSDKLQQDFQPCRFPEPPLRDIPQLARNAAAALLRTTRQATAGHLISASPQLITALVL
jgi:hypothetical protein